MEDLNYKLSEYIKLIRFKKKLSQEDVANKIKVSRVTYGIWENNPTKLDLETLSKISEALDTDISIFFNQYIANCNNKT